MDRATSEERGMGHYMRHSLTGWATNFLVSAMHSKKPGLTAHAATFFCTEHLRNGLEASPPTNNNDTYPNGKLDYNFGSCSFRQERCVWSLDPTQVS